MSRTTAHRTMLAAAGLAIIPFAFAFLSPRSAPKVPTSFAANTATHTSTHTTASPHIYANLSASGAITAAALTPAQAGADPYFVEPRVPRAAGTPCVDTLVRNLTFFEYGGSTPSFTWTPSGACPGPWAKIMLVVEITGPRDISAAAMRVHFDNTIEGDGSDAGGGVIFMGSPQQHELVGTWRYERDVTEYADALHRGTQVGYGIASRDNEYQDFDVLTAVATVVRLVYYPASSSTPAQRVADEMRSLFTQDQLGVAGWTFDNLPRNIERAYLDVMARPLAQRVWYSCVPSAAMAMFPELDSRFGLGDYRPFLAGPELGCAAEQGSYREVEVLIDGQLAGLAPVFPWLPSQIGGTTIDYPAPSVQALNVMPYRVDLTPFAALLNDGNPHDILARVTNSANGGAAITGQLLLYLDKGREVVTGALTRNTLASQPSVPAISHTLTESGDTVQGDITTYLRREYNIDGYVDTSQGRVRSTVYQVSRFSNTQSLRVTGPDEFPTNVPYEQDYAQKVRLSSTVDRVARRIRGTTLLSEDKDYTTYPLTIDFANGGVVDWFESLPAPLSDGYGLYVHQGRGMRASHYRRGMSSRYETSLSDTFYGSRAHREATPTSPAATFDWLSKRRYLFTDNRGSCYSAGITTANGELQTRTRGTECPNGVNGLRWYSHPDGAPEAMLWVASP
jgi:hypothetical protein